MRPAPEAAPPATLVIFGVNGDLVRRLLTPALINMTASGLAGDDLTIIGVDRADGSEVDLRQRLDAFDVATGGEGDVDKTHGATGAAWKRLRERISYLQGDVTKAATFERLRERIDAAGTANVAFYLAIAPSLFGDIVEGLGKAGLLDEDAAGGFRRVAIEKPFGADLDSAIKLNARILKVADESQFYRVDHFLGKETVQNIMVARFANAMIEAVWNNQYIDHVQITAAETVDVGTRGSFYDATGALRDMVPNHLFQLLSMVGMEAPNSFDAAAIRDEKAKLLKAIRTPTAQEAARDAVRGVYTQGRVDGQAVGNYRDADHVASDSRTETYVALKLMIDSWRWAGVPFYLRTGKAMAAHDSEVVVTFKPVPYSGFRGADLGRLPSNKLVIQIQPDEGIDLDFVAKRPGPAMDTAPVTMRFSYGDAFDIGHATGYETLFYDLLRGDQTLFQRADGIEAAWAAVQPILDHWAQGQPEEYAAGSDGPTGAATLLERDGRAWHRLNQ